MRYFDQETALFVYQVWRASDKREDRATLRKLLTPLQYALDVRSLRLELPRRSGTTTAAILLSNEIGSIIVVPTYRDRECIVMHSRELDNYTYAMSDIESPRRRPKEPSLVIVDGASRLQQKDFDLLIHSFSYADPFYVLLG